MRVTRWWCCGVLLLGLSSWAQTKTVTEDKDWSKQSAVLEASLEAEWIVRLGDVDNLNFGWPEGFDPFCGRMTESHAWPWEPQPDDLPGLDRILLSSRLNPGKPKGCSSDGYSGSFDKKKSKPVPLRLPLASLKGAKVSNAFLQLFIDDFQAPSMCSKYQLTVNGKRFAEGEKLLNAIDQTGPVGKLVTLPLPEEFFADLAAGKDLVLTIDDAVGAPDGFALDFVRLLVNRKRESTCKGSIRGVVVEKESQAPIAGAQVRLSDRTSVTTDAEGRFTLAGVPTGFEVLTASASGYADGSAGADVGQGDENPEVTIPLEKGKTFDFDGQQLKLGEALSLDNILFDAGKADLKPASKPTLDKVVQLLTAHPTAEIELAGHTSSEGDAALNRSLSYRRVKSCKDYLASKKIDPGRVIAVGYGPDRPVASNDTETGRKQNRRVELRVVKQ